MKKLCVFMMFDILASPMFVNANISCNDGQVCPSCTSCRCRYCSRYDNGEEDNYSNSDLSRSFNVPISSSSLKASSEEVIKSNSDDEVVKKNAFFEIINNEKYDDVAKTILSWIFVISFILYVFFTRGDQSIM